MGSQVMPGWNFMSLPDALVERIKGYAGMVMFNSEEGVIIVLCENADGWEWREIDACKNKTVPCPVVPLKTIEE